MISELLLCQIFWQWGTTQLPDEAVEGIAHPQVVVDYFDEEEDLDAKIWNSLLQKRLQGIEGEMNFYLKSLKSARTESKASKATDSE